MLLVNNLEAVYNDIILVLRGIPGWDSALESNGKKWPNPTMPGIDENLHLKSIHKLILTLGDD